MDPLLPRQGPGLANGLCLDLFLRKTLYPLRCQTHSISGRFSPINSKTWMRPVLQEADSKSNLNNNDLLKGYYLNN